MELIEIKENLANLPDLMASEIKKLKLQKNKLEEKLFEISKIDARLGLFLKSQAVNTGKKPTDKEIAREILVSEEMDKAMAEKIKIKAEYEIIDGNLKALEYKFIAARKLAGLEEKQMNMI